MFPPNQQHIGSVGDSAQCVEDTLMIRRCADCDRLFAPLTAECFSCASVDLEWVPCAGAGWIVSWRVVDRAGTRGELAPLTIAIVELDEGPWVYTSIEGNVPALPARPVRVHFQPRPQHDRFPVFTVSATDQRQHRTPA
ncbi:Zn-ribbon domain-containing OB-fold protein [Nocardia beijingensis]|uniref:Zn-ribbon domain-containing OB-fold protein n=1 Tax=Nocardia beijingensis TaxID=95162 RepID=UPI000A07CCCC|nr:OB-fold domain-containing protein [Nocardia beijingensis]